MNKLFTESALLTRYDLQALTECERIAIFNLSKRYPNIDLIELATSLTFGDLKDPDKIILVDLIKRNGILASIATRIATPTYTKLNTSNSNKKIKLCKRSKKIISDFLK